VMPTLKRAAAFRDGNQILTIKMFHLIIQRCCVCDIFVSNVDIR